MRRHLFSDKLVLILGIAVIAAQSWAHVPYLEHNDFSDKQPFTVDHSIEQSLAIYGWLDNNKLNNREDIDVFELGNQADSLLIDMIKNPQQVFQYNILQHKLIPRESTVSGAQ